MLKVADNKKEQFSGVAKKMQTRSQKFAGDCYVKVKHTMKLLKDVCSYSFNCKSDNVSAAKKGCFSVIAVGGVGDPKKFFIALDYLSYPPFLELLEAAEKEFGFKQQGVLAVPCEASELQRILSID